MNPRPCALMLIIGIVAAAGAVSAKTPTANEIVEQAIAAIETGSTLADHDMLRIAVREEETASDGTTSKRDLTFIAHGGRLENVRLERGQGISLVLNNNTGWAMIRGELDSRPQSPRMAAGVIRQTLFPLLLPYSLRMNGVQPGLVTEGSFDGTPAWVIETTFIAGFFAAPSMVAPWRIFIGRENHRLLGADFLPVADFRAVSQEGVRYRYLKWADVDGLTLPSEVLLDGIDFNGVENGHVRVTKISSTTAGPLDLSLFIHPEESQRLDSGEVE